ncbi:MAG: hypothetical protein ISN29_12515 [Gammaproteobacteria bacterium AqS3]|nr:hypothetical protein [Gammaproteobacteria bacterium AqS3]
MPGEENKTQLGDDRESSTQEPIRRRPGSRGGRKRKDSSEEFSQGQSFLIAASALFALAWIVSKFLGGWMFLPLLAGIACCVAGWDEIVRTLRSSFMVLVAAIVFIQTMQEIPDALSGDDTPEQDNAQSVRHDGQINV